MNLTPTFSTGAIGRPTLDPEQERIARLLEALVTQTPGGLVQSTGETLGMVGDVLGSIGQPQRAEALGQQVRRTLPDIVSAVTQRPAEVATAFGQGMEQEVLDKGAGAVFGLEDLILPGGKALGMLGASAMAMGKLPPASKAAQDIVDLSKARQTPRQMRLQELADEQIARGEVPGALERGRLADILGEGQTTESIKLAALKTELSKVQKELNRLSVEYSDKKAPSEVGDAWNVLHDKEFDLQKQISDLEPSDLIQSDFDTYESATVKSTARRRTAAQSQLDQFANLDDVEKARLDRAVQQGFNVDAFHGTKGDIESFDPGLLGVTTGAPSARRGFFFSADPETANNYARAAEGYILGRSDQIREAVNLAEKEIQRVNLEAAKIDIEARKKAGYYEKLNELVNKERAGELLNFERQNKMEELDRQMAAEIAKNPAYLETKAKADQLSKNRANIPSDYGMNVMPVKLRLQNPLVHDFGGQSYREVSYHDLLKQAQEAGNDGAIFRNTTDGGGVTDIYVVFEPSQIRSRYAAFDPNEGKSGSLIASAPPILFPLGVGTAAAAYSANQEQ